MQQTPSQIEWSYIIIYAIVVCIVGGLGYYLLRKYKDKIPEKYRSTSSSFGILALFLGVFSQSQVVKVFTGQEYAADILDFISACFIVIGPFLFLLSVKFDEYTDKLTKDTINPLKKKIENLEINQEKSIQDFKREHIKIYNLKQLDAFTDEDPIFSHNIVKQEGYLHIASLMRDFDIVLSGKLMLRSYDQFLNILTLLAEMLDCSYNMTIVDHINASKIPSTMAGGYSFIEDYTNVMSKLKNQVKKCERIIIVDRDEDRKNERLLLLLFSQLNVIPTIYIDLQENICNIGGSRIDPTYFSNRTRILITKNGCNCSSSNSSNNCTYCYSIKFVSPYNGEVSDNLFKSELNTLKSNPTFSKEFPNYIKLFHTRKKQEHIKEFEYDKSLFSIDLSTMNILTKDTIFDGLPNDEKEYYTLYKDVHDIWINNLSLPQPNNIYGCDTTLLDNEIEDWLNRPFYQYVLKQNGIIAKELKKKGKSLKRFFIIDKVRKLKIQALVEIIKAHIEKEIDVSIVSADSLKMKKIEYIYDYNYTQNMCIFEIAGLRRCIRDDNIELCVGDKSPTYPYWEKYKCDDKASNSDMYEKISEFNKQLDSIGIKITKDNIINVLNEYITREITREDQKNKLMKRINKNEKLG